MQMQSASPRSFTPEEEETAFDEQDSLQPQQRGSVAFLQFQITPPTLMNIAAVKKGTTNSEQTNGITQESTIDSAATASASSPSTSAAASMDAIAIACVHHIEVSKTDKANIISIDVFMRIPLGVDVDALLTYTASSSAAAMEHVIAASSNGAIVASAVGTPTAAATGAGAGSNSTSMSASSTAASSSIQVATPPPNLFSSVKRVEEPPPRTALVSASTVAASSSSTSSSSPSTPPRSLLQFSIPSYNFAKNNYFMAASHLLSSYPSLFAMLCPDESSSSSSSSADASTSTSHESTSAAAAAASSSSHSLVSPTNHSSSLSEEALSVLIEKAVEKSYLKWVSKERNSSNSALISLLSSLRIAWDVASAFVEQEVQLSDLLCLNEQDLRNFLPKMGPRRRLTQWIEEERKRRTQTMQQQLQDSPREADDVSSSPTPLSPSHDPVSEIDHEHSTRASSDNEYDDGDKSTFDHGGVRKGRGRTIYPSYDRQTSGSTTGVDAESDDHTQTPSEQETDEPSRLTSTLHDSVVEEEEEEAEEHEGNEDDGTATETASEEHSDQSDATTPEAVKPRAGRRKAKQNHMHEGEQQDTEHSDTEHETPTKLNGLHTAPPPSSIRSHNLNGLNTGKLIPIESDAPTTETKYFIPSSSSKWIVSFHEYGTSTTSCVIHTYCIQRISSSFSYHQPCSILILVLFLLFCVFCFYPSFSLHCPSFFSPCISFSCLVSSFFLWFPSIAPYSC